MEVCQGIGFSSLFGPAGPLQSAISQQQSAGSPIHPFLPLWARYLYLIESRSACLPQFPLLPAKLPRASLYLPCPSRRGQPRTTGGNDVACSISHSGLLLLLLLYAMLLFVSSINSRSISIFPVTPSAVVCALIASLFFCGPV